LTAANKKIAKQEKNMIAQVQQAVGYAWDLLFSMGVAAAGDVPAVPGGIVVRFLGFLTANPILLLPIGFYLIFLGIKTVRKLVTGY
jgi:hypothetical protein